VSNETKAALASPLGAVGLYTAGSFALGTTLKCGDIFLSEQDQQETTRLEIDLHAKVRFTHPDTMTAEEVAEALASHMSRLARLECWTVIASMPNQVVPVVLPQLKDMVVYETRMWELRKGAKPAIREKQETLPLLQ
jgi:hypothetical protein